MKSSELIKQLQILSKRARGRLLAYGVFAVGAGGAVSLLTIIAIDWALWLPAPLRLFVSLWFLLGFAWAVLHWIVRPMRIQLGPDVIASKLERRFPHLEDRLSSTVNFLQTGGKRLAQPD